MKKTTAPNSDLILAAALAKHLLSPSSRFELGSQYPKAAALDGLRCLATLDQPTRLSLPQLPTEAETAEAVRAAKALATAASAAQAAALAVPRFGSHKAEYQAGLTNPTVIDALLDLHTRMRPASSTQAPLAGFRPQQSRAVDAQPKPGIQPAPRSPQRPGTTRVFRTRGD